MNEHSYHIFYFPFKWKVQGLESELLTVQTDLNRIEINPLSNWLPASEILDKKEADDLYNEKNYYYQFVHPVLYDDGKPGSLLKHFERKEPKQRDVSYMISKKNGKTYTLKVDTINLNLYTTGVGMLTFYLINDRDDQKTKEDILAINQYGRRIFPPFIADLDCRGEIAEYIKIEGLNGNEHWFYENFSSYTNQNYWKPACFINHLITDLSDKLDVFSVIDDRMFANCWYPNNELSGKIGKGINIDKKEKEQKFDETDDFWYKYTYVDCSDVSCKNDEMRKELIRIQTYKRWQLYGTLYGASRYSFVSLTDETPFNRNVIGIHMRTVYARMIELVLVQRASILRFSDEVTRVSRLSRTNKLDKEIIGQISSLYKEYIRFINQIYFREVTTQDQGIELYDLISETLKIKEYVQDLDQKIEELYQYVNILDDKIRNKNAEILNIIAIVFLPVTLSLTMFSAFPEFREDCNGWEIFLITVCIYVLMLGLLKIIQLFKKRK